VGAMLARAQWIVRRDPRLNEKIIHAVSAVF
jgi:hypothetical protein